MEECLKQKVNYAVEYTTKINDFTGWENPPLTVPSLVGLLAVE